MSCIINVYSFKTSTGVGHAHPLGYQNSESMSCDLKEVVIHIGLRLIREIEKVDYQ